MLKLFHRYHSDDLEDSIWVCDACHIDGVVEGDHLESENDTYGDHYCHICGLCYNEDTGLYEDRDGNEVE